MENQNPESCPTDDRADRNAGTDVTPVFARVKDFVRHCLTFFQKVVGQGQKKAVTIANKDGYLSHYPRGTRVGQCGTRVNEKWKIENGKLERATTDC